MSLLSAGSISLDSTFNHIKIYSFYRLLIILSIFSRKFEMLIKFTDFYIYIRTYLAANSIVNKDYRILNNFVNTLVHILPQNWKVNKFTDF